jgi:hypothetical protein
VDFYFLLVGQASFRQFFLWLATAFFLPPQWKKVADRLALGLSERHKSSGSHCCSEPKLSHTRY